MKQYIVRRLFLSVIILFGVSVIIYALVRMMPGDFVESMTAGNQKVTPEMIMRLKHL